MQRRSHSAGRVAARLAVVGTAVALVACSASDAGDPAATPAVTDPAPGATAGGPAPNDGGAVASTPSPSPTSAGSDTSTSAVVAEAPAALQFTAPLIGGGDIEMAALAARPVLLWFWAPW